MTAKLAPVPRRPPDTAEELTTRRAADLARVGRFLGRLQDEGYFGKVMLSMQNGKLVELRIEQVMKVEDL
jgi:hypothetical protein